MGLWKLWVKRTHSTELTINPYPYRLCALVLGHLDIRNIRTKGKDVTIGQQKKICICLSHGGCFLLYIAVRVQPEKWNQ